MAGLVTQETNKSVTEYINKIENQSKQADGKMLLAIIQDITGVEPKIWGDHFLIGFGKYSYSRKGNKDIYEWFHIGFAVRKTKLTVYLTFDLTKQEELLSKLGKCKWGKGCLYINKLADIDLDILKQLIQKSKEAKWH